MRITPVILGFCVATSIVTLFENPGMWMYQCHILEYEENGMMGMVMVEPSAEEQME